MRKIIALLLSLTMVLSMTACGGSDSASAASAGTSAASAAASTTAADDSKAETAAIPGLEDGVFTWKTLSGDVRDTLRL